MTTTDILAEYRRLAERLTLSDGERPLMRDCPCLENLSCSCCLGGGWHGRHGPFRCEHCDGKNYVPRLDLRDGQLVIPLALVLEVLFEAGVTIEEWYWVPHSNLLNRPAYGLSIRVDWQDKDRPDLKAVHADTVIEAVLAAANAALDAREAKP